jgi:hypothetical protein
MKKLINIILVAGLVACGGKGKNKNVETNLNGNDSTVTKTEVLDDARPSPLKKTTGLIDGVKTTVQWGSPSVKGREIWGMIVPYDEVWRTGANEATWIEFDKDVMINDKALPAGKYGFFSIPREGEWTLIFNSVWNQWGAFEYDEKKDAVRVNIKPDTSSLCETLEYTIEKDGVSMCWEKLKIRFTVKKK